MGALLLRLQLMTAPSLNTRQLKALAASPKSRLPAVKRQPPPLSRQLIVDTPSGTVALSVLSCSAPSTTLTSTVTLALALRVWALAAGLASRASRAVPAMAARARPRRWAWYR